MTDLDTAQRLSLIQRHLEAAQLNIDSATELLRIVMENGIAAQVEREGPPLARPRKVAVKRQRKMPKELIDEYLATHKAEFLTADLLKWAKQRNYSFNKTSVQQQLYVMANQKKTLIALEKGSGRYQKAA
jgi:hypothetical protein